jgi:hypothetical protein
MRLSDENIYPLRVSWGGCKKGGFRMWRNELHITTVDAGAYAAEFSFISKGITLPG